jgi:hypothetical protein
VWKIPEIMPQSACDIKLQNPAIRAIEEFATDTVGLIPETSHR